MAFICYILWKRSGVSTQSTLNNEITNAKELYKWAAGFFKNISFRYSTVADYNNEGNFLKPRFKVEKLNKNTRKYYSFVPHDSCHIICREIPLLKECVKHKIN